jgi:hypothetical protein
MSVTHEAHRNSFTEPGSRTLREPWLWLSILVFASCLTHLLVDLKIGIYGETSETLTLWDGLNAGLYALLFATWSFVLAMATWGDKSALAAAFSLAALWGALGNGVVSLFIAPPPSLGFPYQDLAHFGSLIFGTLASIATWKAMRRAAGRVTPLLPILVVLLMVCTSYATVKVRRAHPAQDAGRSAMAGNQTEGIFLQRRSVIEEGAAGTVFHTSRA